ncbi:hypothetical protein [Bifidobacterium castoris]|uniref:Uncharacterized protein n=1 Tax=Bifidobacterium castoris TaxID=2306972 RepID=A0A430F5U4_9BIFI|nr:hypothetical protein [Bifidobacterium castoris]RSX46091.1 hypothetical protein D2E22_1663 [Bifidobacterium castoris]
MTRYKDSEGYVYEERPCGRREYVESPLLRDLRADREAAQQEVDRLYDMLDAYDAKHTEYEPYERHGIHNAYIEARIRLTGIDSRITREQWRLMRKSSEYGYIDANGERVPYDAAPVAPELDPDDITEPADETDEPDGGETRCFEARFGAVRDGHGAVFVRIASMAELLADAVAAARRSTLQEISEHIDALIAEIDGDEACTDERSA